jgi:Ca2+-binding RTX toxin-like protein
LIGGAGIDTLLGGDGNDLLVGDDVLIANILVDSTLFGTDANSLFGADGNDLLDGGANDDTLLGGAGDDTVLGGDGNDLIIAGDFVLQEAPDGNDSIVGGAGDDTLVFDAFGAGVGITVDLTDTGGQLISSEYGTDTISGIEAVVGTGLDDALFGGAGDETLVGSAGNDLLVGGGGNDLLLGGANDDTLMIADANFNVVDGGTGADLLVFDGSFDLDITLLARHGRDVAVSARPHETRDSAHAGKRLPAIVVQDVANLVDAPVLDFVIGAHQQLRQKPHEHTDHPGGKAHGDQHGQRGLNERGVVE